jgi:hypothetical protein
MGKIIFLLVDQQFLLKYLHSINKVKWILLIHNRLDVMSIVASQLEQTKRLSNDQFRQWYKSVRIPRYYHPWLHVLFNFGTLFLLTIVNLFIINDWNFGTFAVLGFTFLLGNVVVWLLHRYPLHRRSKLWPYPYDTHTVMHHRYFTSDFITYKDSQDFFAVFFPASVVAGFAFLVQPLFYFGFKYIFGSDLGHAFVAGTAFYFFLYEFVHWASHLPPSHPLLKIFWLRYMREHHIIHHNPRLMMKYNFCIVYPLMDILMNTKYRDSFLPKDDLEDFCRDVEANL